jgi:hypothetical protein
MIMPIISQITAFQPGPFFEKLLHKSQEEINYTKYVQGIEWNKRNQIHDKLMKEMRAYWVNKWFGEQTEIENIRQTETENIIIEMTILPEDVIELIGTYLRRPPAEYPYQVKYI